MLFNNVETEKTKSTRNYSMSAGHCSISAGVLPINGIKIKIFVYVRLNTIKKYACHCILNFFIVFKIAFDIILTSILLLDQYNT